MQLPTPTTSTLTTTCRRLTATRPAASAVGAAEVRERLSLLHTRTCVITSFPLHSQPPHAAPQRPPSGRAAESADSSLLIVLEPAPPAGGAAICVLRLESAAPPGDGGGGSEQHFTHLTLSDDDSEPTRTPVLLHRDGDASGGRLHPRSPLARARSD